MDAAEFRRTRARSMTEDELLRDVRQMARTLGWDTYHTLRSRGSEPGWPDLVLAKAGVLLFRELKREQGVLTPSQERWLSHLRAAGLDADVWRPTDLLDGSIHHVLHGAAPRPPDLRELALPAHDR